MATNFIKQEPTIEPKLTPDMAKRLADYIESVPQATRDFWVIIWWLAEKFP